MASTPKKRPAPSSRGPAPPGTIYLNGKRFWWAVKLPGETKRRARPLVPPGERFATTDPDVAVELASQLWTDAVGGLAADRIATLGELVARYQRHAAGYYRDPDSGQPTGEIANIAAAVSYLAGFAETPPDAFGPLALQAIQTAMVDAGLARTTINKRVGIIRRMFRWAVRQQLVRPAVDHGLSCVPGLRRGRTDARESAPIGPVDRDVVKETQRFLPATVAAMVELQLLTAMRPGEVCQLKPEDLDRDGDVWHFSPAKHKTAHHGHSRRIAIGPKAQDVLAPFLDRPAGRVCFSPRQAARQRRARRRRLRVSALTPSQAARDHRSSGGQAGAEYTSRSYYKAIHYAIAAANKARAKNGQAPLESWAPNQLRHTQATTIRKELGQLGAEGARATLGHRSLSVTATYAELDMSLADDVARRLG